MLVVDSQVAAVVVDAAVVVVAADAVVVVVPAALAFQRMQIVRPVDLECASFIAACGDLHRAPLSPKTKFVA